VVAADFKKHLEEADRTALIALTGVVCSVGVWVLWAWIGTFLTGQTFYESLFQPDPAAAVTRLSAIVIVLAVTLLAQGVYAHWFRAEERLRVERGKVEQLYANSPDAIIALATGYTASHANPVALELMADTTGVAEGTAKCHQALWGLDEPCAGCQAAQVFARGAGWERTVFETVRGAERCFEHVIYPVLTEDGGVESAVEIYRDVTDLRLAEETLRRANLELERRVEEGTRELAAKSATLKAEVGVRKRAAVDLIQSEERYRQLVDGSPDMVLVQRGGLITFLNPQGVLLLGVESPDEALGMPVGELWESCSEEFGADELEQALITGDLDHAVPALLRRADGGTVHVELSVDRLELDGEPAIQCVARDITERLSAQRTIERMAYYDALTELPNRVLFHDRLHSALARGRRRSERVAVVFIDLDDFKAINDSLGHIIGDGVLEAVAARLSNVLREEDTVSRYSADEFAIMARIENRPDAELLAKRIVDSFRDSVTVDGYELHVTASVGVAIYPTDGADDLELMRNAETAMFRAKEWGRGVYRLYTPEMSASALDRLELETALRSALDREEFELHYQPQIDLRTGQPVGIEALVRWRHPTHGLMLPGLFVALAEQSGLMPEIGQWILRTACAHGAAWQAEGLSFGRVCVNISAREFVNQDVVEDVKRALELTGLPAANLELEITESAALHNSDQVLSALGHLQDMGVRVAIDDFGTGYSSMSYLKRFPIQTLKIAQDFMCDVHVNAQSAAIAGTIIDLCHELDLDIVAEGVEHESQLDFLESRGCYVIQGYLFSRPLPENDLVDLLRRGGVPVRHGEII
jgi:diguanylate cyclase (GGDEF)-like protein/PAS domain S-box-containing protein